MKHLLRAALSPALSIGLTVCVVSAAGCAGLRPSTPDSGAAGDPKHTYALLLNGGGRREINYQSHLIHLKQLVALLRETKIDPDRVAIFSGDGADPATDLATRELVEESTLWLLPRGGSTLRPEIVYVDSQIEGFRLQPARKDAIQAWFDTTGKTLGKGDTLLLYVTDHGEKNPKDTANNTITLWNDELSVVDLRALLGALDPEVRVVQVMSQCFSGAFARTMYTADGNGDPGGNVCGYFSVTADRPAYGCYPENRGKDGIGHSHMLFEALDVLGNMPEANRRIQVTDRTPDVPHTTSDFYLQKLLQRAADQSKRDSTQLVDELLAEAWRDRAVWEPEIRLLDRIGRTYGTFSPRSMQEIETESKALPDFSKQLRTYAGRWSAALESLRVENWKEFLEARPTWRDRLDANKQSYEDATNRRQLLDELLADLETFSRQDEQRYARLVSLHDKAEEASSAAYRTDVRLAALLRMQTILSAIAGRVYLTQRGTPEERTAYEQLIACEALPLGPPAKVASAALLDSPEPFPTLADERSLVEKVMPAWMGIEYRPQPDAQRKEQGTERGAVVVTNVFPDSAAAKAGLEVGDVILGPPGAPFTEPHAVREWTMRGEIGQPAPLAVLRDSQKVALTLRPAPFPLKMPELPGPPPVGAKAPPLRLEMFRGGQKVADAKQKLLFFWATWCGPCKTAVPEILAFAAERGIEVLAITDEAPEVLEQFYGQSRQPVAELVAIDPLRITFRDYGVSGTPTFVLVDDDHIVRYYQAGYRADVGLKVDGWKWAARPASATAPEKPGT